MKQNPLFSIVITSYTIERLEDIHELLESINNQTYENLEIIVVIEHSGDLFNQVSDYTEKLPYLNTKVIRANGDSGASAGRNLGIAHSNGEIIAFIDDDAIPFPDWAERMIEIYEDDSIIGVTGPAYPLWKDKPALWLPQEFFWLINCNNWVNWTTVREVRNIWGMNASFRREAFDSGGFEISLGPHGGGIEGWKRHMPEEIELSVRIRERTGKRIVYSPQPKVSHKVYPYKLKFKYIMQSAYLMGFSKYLTKKLYSKSTDSEEILSQEKDLLWRIITKEPQHLIKEIIYHPYLAWRRFMTVVITLTAVAFGYMAGISSNFIGLDKYYSS